MKGAEYYKQIDNVLKEYEEGKHYHTRDIDWACNRIAWCTQWRKITREQTDELANRATAILDNNLFIK